MYKEFLDQHKIPYSYDNISRVYIIFGRSFKENTLWSWIKKSKLAGLTSEQIFLSIKYELPFGRLNEITLEDLIKYNILNNGKYLYHRKVKERGLLATWERGEKWKVEAIGRPELGERILTREAINLHLSLNSPIEYILKKIPTRLNSEKDITADEVLKYGMISTQQKRFYKKYKPYGIYVNFKDNRRDYYKIEIDGVEQEISAHRLRTVFPAFKRLEVLTVEEVRWLLQHFSAGYEKLSVENIRYCIHHNIQQDYVFVFNMVRTAFPEMDMYIHGQDDVEISMNGKSLRGNRLLIRDRVQTWEDWTKVLTPRNQFYSSAFEQEVEIFLRELGVSNIQKNVRTIAGISELDFVLPDHNIAIECNGIYYHSENYKSSSFHQNKTLACRDNGIHLIHIWEDQWRNRADIVKSILRVKLRVGDLKRVQARKCTVRPITYKQAVTFLSGNHLNGFSVSKKHFGLYYEETLIMVASLSDSRKFLKHKNWELVRLASLKNYYIVGGFSKLLKYAAGELKIQQLYSYVDFDLYDGRGYEKIGFKYVKLTAPGYFYVHTDLSHRKHRYNFTRQALIKQGFDPAASVQEITARLRYHKVYNSGSLIYVKNF